MTIYCISTSAFGFANPYDSNLVKLADETGGRVLYPLENVYKDTSGYLSQPSDDGNYALKVGLGEYASTVARGMYHAVSDIAGEITTQYIIRYVPADESDKSYRNLKVTVDLGNVKVRARKAITRPDSSRYGMDMAGLRKVSPWRGRAASSILRTTPAGAGSTRYFWWRCPDSPKIRGRIAPRSGTRRTACEVAPRLGAVCRG